MEAAATLSATIIISRKNPDQSLEFPTTLVVGVIPKIRAGQQTLICSKYEIVFEFTPDIYKPDGEGSTYLGPATLTFNGEHLKGNAKYYVGPDGTSFHAEGLREHYLHYSIEASRPTA